MFFGAWMPEARPGGSTGVNDAPGRRTGTLSLLLLIEQVLELGAGANPIASELAGPFVLRGQ